MREGMMLGPQVMLRCAGDNPGVPAMALVNCRALRPCHDSGCRTSAEASKEVEAKVARRREGDDKAPTMAKCQSDGWEPESVVSQDGAAKPPMKRG